MRHGGRPAWPDWIEHQGAQTRDGDKFEVLSALVDAYEREHFAIPAPDPIAAIPFRVEEGGPTNKNLLSTSGARARHR